MFDIMTHTIHFNNFNIKYEYSFLLKITIKLKKIKK